MSDASLRKALEGLVAEYRSGEYVPSSAAEVPEEIERLLAAHPPEPEDLAQRVREHVGAEVCRGIARDLGFLEWVVSNHGADESADAIKRLRDLLDPPKVSA